MSKLFVIAMLVLLVSAGAFAEKLVAPELPADDQISAPERKLKDAERQMGELREENARLTAENKRKLDEATENANKALHRGDAREAKRWSEVAVKIYEGMKPTEVKAEIKDQIQEHDKDYTCGGDGRVDGLLKKYKVLYKGDMDAEEEARKAADKAEAQERKNNDSIIAGGLAGLILFVLIVVAIAIRRRDAAR
jgi:hypothetical protein